MINSKFISMYRLLTLKEANEFYGFCKSDMVYVRTGVINLLAYLIKLENNFTEKTLNENQVYKKILSAGNFNKALLLTILTSATKALESFLAVKQLLKYSFDSTRFLTAELIDRNDSGNIPSYIKAIEKQNVSALVNDSEHYHHLYQTQELKHIASAKLIQPKVMWLNYRVN